MLVPEEFFYAWKVEKVPAWKAYNRLESICRSYEQGIGITHTNNNVPYIDYMLRSEGFLDFDTNTVLRTVKVTPTEKALEIYNQNVLKASENSH